MATVISKASTQINELNVKMLPQKIIGVLPYGILCELERMCESISRNERIEEIRLRSGRRAYLTISGRGIKRNVALCTVLTEGELSEILDRMCDGSLYAYSESIIKGYVSLGEGIRVGVCGRASVEDGRVLGVYNISALNVRLPCGTVKLERGFLERVRAEIMLGSGVLIYSPPAQGKTTMLRSLVFALSGGVEPLRVAVVDTRDELGAIASDEALSLDVLCGYPKAEGIRIATAFMNPQVVICDEIGDEREADAISEAQNCGVPLIATAHGSDPRSILQRRGMRRLHEVGAFGIYVGIRIDAGGGFACRVSRREEISLENTWDSVSLP